MRLSARLDLCLVVIRILRDQTTTTICQGIQKKSVYYYPCEIERIALSLSQPFIHLGNFLFIGENIALTVEESSGSCRSPDCIQESSLHVRYIFKGIETMMKVQKLT